MTTSSHIYKTFISSSDWRENVWVRYHPLGTSITWWSVKIVNLYATSLNLSHQQFICKAFHHALLCSICEHFPDLHEARSIFSSIFNLPKSLSTKITAIIERSREKKAREFPVINWWKTQSSQPRERSLVTHARHLTDRARGSPLDNLIKLNYLWTLARRYEVLKIKSWNATSSRPRKYHNTSAKFSRKKIVRVR